MIHSTDIKKVRSEDPSWYKKIWTLDIKNMGWVEETTRQIDFMWDVLNLQGHEKILDLACGFGRHSLELARRGCTVIGVDITTAYIDDAQSTTLHERLNAVFIQSDIRDLEYRDEFDIVLNIADGGIGYLENDEENVKIFEIAANALKRNGKHLIDICNADYAKRHFPKRHWLVGTNAISLADFEWDSEKSVMYYGGIELPYAKKVEKPSEMYCNPTRLYGKNELHAIFHKNGMRVVNCYGNFDKNLLGSDDILQIQVIAEKE